MSKILRQFDKDNPSSASANLRLRETVVGGESSLLFWLRRHRGICRECPLPTRAGGDCPCVSLSQPFGRTGRASPRIRERSNGRLSAKADALK